MSKRYKVALLIGNSDIAGETQFAISGPDVERFNTCYEMARFIERVLNATLDFNAGKDWNK